MKKWIIIVLVFGIIILFGLMAYYKLYGLKHGKYYDNQGNLLGSCTYILDKPNGLISLTGWSTTKFYNLQGVLVGTCTDYSGPGSSGWKGGCDENAVNNGVGEKVQTEIYAGKVGQKYSCNY